VIDEFQRAGKDLLLAVKQVADRDRTRGQLLPRRERSGIPRSSSTTVWSDWTVDLMHFRFTVGIVVHAGPHVLALGERLWAVPVTAV